MKIKRLPGAGAGAMPQAETGRKPSAEDGLIERIAADHAAILGAAE